MAALSNAITVAYEGTAPTKSGQIVVEGGKGVDLTAYRGVATITLDGTGTTGTVDFIDGTETLPFTPSAVLANIQEGTSTDGLTLTVGANDNKGFAITLSAAGTNTKTVLIPFIVFK